MDNDQVFHNTPPWAYTAKCTCLIKTPPKNPVGKKGSKEKEYIAHASYVALVASLKTLSEKTQWEKVTKEKKVQLIFGISFDLRDQYEF